MDFDIVIAGGGLVGASLAVALKSSGWRVAVVEPISPKATEQPSFDDRQTALAPTSRRFFAHLGLWETIASQAAPIAEIHVSDRGHAGFTRLTAQAEGLPALGHVTPNRVLGAALGPAMREAARVFCPAKIVATAMQDPSRRSIQIETDEGVQTLSTQLLVVADGKHSMTREALGIGLKERDYGQSAIIANLKTEYPHAGRAYERFTTAGPLAVLPGVNDSVSVVWALPHEQAQAALEQWSESVFLNRLQAVFGWRLGRLHSLGKRQIYPLQSVMANALIEQRAVVLGNAAHALHPVAGQGLNLALRDVAALAEVMGVSSAASANATQRPPDPGAQALLQAYAHERHRDCQRTFAFTDGLVRLFSNQWLPLVAARNVGLTLLDLIPPARRALLKQATGAALNVPPLCRDELPVD